MKMELYCVEDHLDVRIFVHSLLKKHYPFSELPFWIDKQPFLFSKIEELFKVITPIIEGAALARRTGRTAGFKKYVNTFNKFYSKKFVIGLNSTELNLDFEISDEAKFVIPYPCFKKCQTPVKNMETTFLKFWTAYEHKEMIGLVNYLVHDYKSIYIFADQELGLTDGPDIYRNDRISHRLQDEEARGWNNLLNHNDWVEIFKELSYRSDVGKAWNSEIVQEFLLSTVEKHYPWSKLPKWVINRKIFLLEKLQELYPAMYKTYTSASKKEYKRINQLTLILKRLGICKDVRLYISKIIWNSRFQIGFYPFSFLTCWNSACLELEGSDMPEGEELILAPEEVIAICLSNKDVKLSDIKIYKKECQCDYCLHTIARGNKDCLCDECTILENEFFKRINGNSRTLGEDITWDEFLIDKDFETLIPDFDSSFEEI